MAYLGLRVVWQSYPDLQPLYDAARSYLEIPQRMDLLNTRVEVGPINPLLLEYPSESPRPGSPGYATAAERVSLK